MRIRPLRASALAFWREGRDRRGLGGEGRDGRRSMRLRRFRLARFPIAVSLGLGHSLLLSAPQFLKRVASECGRQSQAPGSDTGVGFTPYPKSSRSLHALHRRAKPRTSTYRQYIDSLQEETRSTFRPRPMSGDDFEANCLGKIHWTATIFHDRHYLSSMRLAERRLQEEAASRRRSASFVSGSRADAR